MLTRTRATAHGVALLIGTVAAVGCHRASDMQTATPLALAETTWRLAVVNGQDAGALRGDQPATLRLTTNRSARGFAGCNNFRGTYTLEGDSLRFGPLITTRRACGIISLEQSFLRALEGTRSFRFQSDSLELRGTQGREAVLVRY